MSRPAHPMSTYSDPEIASCRNESSRQGLLSGVERQYSGTV
jgi:hypothetical protein